MRRGRAPGGGGGWGGGGRRSATGARVRVQWLFTHATVAGLATRIDTGDADATAAWVAAAALGGAAILSGGSASAVTPLTS
ncbi:hypothetical protein, partial [Nocardia abscessus]|uniref:hypothetical protein n=1 Tax=Nocardia abscessus TaxID=120957 RepID=UPI0024550F4E